AAPRLDPRGARLAWVAWRHPGMPWDGTELWIAQVDAHGDLHDARLVAGGPDEAVLEPVWTADGILQFVSDRTGWWNLDRLEDGSARSLWRTDAEVARPPWILGFSHSAVLHDGTILCAVSRDGAWSLERLDPRSRRRTAIATPYSEIGFLHAGPGGAVFVGASPSESPAVVRLDASSGACEVLRGTPAELVLDPALISTGDPCAIPNPSGRP